jgi:hypothetical protein
VCSVPAAVRPFCSLSLFSFLIIVQKLDKQGRPMIIARSSRKSVTPPAEEGYHEEGEEAGEEEEEAEEPARPTKHQCTSSCVAIGQAQGKGKDKGKARAPKPITPSASSRFPPVVRKTRGKSKKAELPSYIPPRAVPTMDTVRLAAESLAKEQREPTVVSETNRD